MAKLSDRVLAEFRATDFASELPGYRLRASAGSASPGPVTRRPAAW